MAFVIPMVGAQALLVGPTKLFDLGTAQIDDDNRTWVYVQADVAVPAGNAPVLGGNFHLTANTGGSYTADAAFAVNEYGWVRKTTSPL